MNLSGVHHEDLRRGMVLARPGSLTVARSVVARLSGSRILGHALQHDAEVTLLAATAQSQAKVRLLDTESLIPGQSCWAQLVLESPMAVLPGDHVVIRSPDETIGGGPVVSVNGRRLRRNDAGTIRSLELALSGAPEDRIFERLSFGPQPTVSLADGLAVDAGELDRLLSGLGTAGSVVLAGDRAYSRAWLEGAELRLESEIDAFMAANPLRRAVPKEHLRRALALTAPDFELVLGRLLAGGRIEERGTGIARHGFEPALSAAQEAEVATFLRALASNPYSPPTDRLPPPPLLAYLVERGDVEDTGAGVVFARSVFEDMVARVREHFVANPTLSLAETRDLFGTSRKYAQAFLERLDALRITRRAGDSRTLRS